MELEKKRIEEERNRKEFEEFERRNKGKRKNRKMKPNQQETSDNYSWILDTLDNKYLGWFLAGVVMLLAVVMVVFFG